MKSKQINQIIDDDSRLTSRVIFRRVIVAGAESVGGQLATARSGMNMTIAYCSRQINVPERFLDAIEQENFEKLPGLVYEKHFIERYAFFLGLTPAPLVESWSEIRGTSLPLSTVQFVPRVSWRDLSSSPVIWRRALASLVIVLLGGYLGTELFVMAAPPSLQVSEPPAGAIVTKSSLEITGTVGKGANVTINGQTIVATSEGDFSVPVVLEPGPNSIRIVAEKRYGRSTVIERQVFLSAPRQVEEPVSHTSLIFSPLP